MRKACVPRAVRRRVAAWARERCCYCQTQERVSGTALVIEQIIPEGLGGESTEANLCLSCRSCNEYKGDRTEGADPVSGDAIRLFHRRADDWREHFVWSPDGTRVEDLTPIGRATVVALRMNRPLTIQARRLWVRAGWHPPKG